MTVPIAASVGRGSVGPSLALDYDSATGNGPFGLGWSLSTAAITRSTKRGLLSGEALALDLKRLELAYAENNHREFELTRNVSLRQLDPVALLTLKATGSCTFTVPEAIFDMENVHYLRRLRSVALSIPAVVGPYTPLHATLTLLGSAVRTSPTLKDGAYGRQGPNDDRFVDYLGSVQQIVTSSGTNDSGMFEANLRDERPLPFEGCGAVSTWRLDLPKGLSSVDRGSISDAVLHLRFTARQAGEQASKQAEAELIERMEDASSADLALMFSLRNDHPTEWNAFAAGTQDLDLTLSRDYFPYFTQGSSLAIDGIDLATKAGDKLARRVALAAPGDALALADIADGLNGADRGARIVLDPDTKVLRRNAAEPVYLIVRYHFD